jgi:hypothetical protein
MGKTMTLAAITSARPSQEVARVVKPQDITLLSDPDVGGIEAISILVGKTWLAINSAHYVRPKGARVVKKPPKTSTLLSDQMSEASRGL